MDSYIRILENKTKKKKIFRVISVRKGFLDFSNFLWGCDVSNPRDTFLKIFSDF